MISTFDNYRLTLETYPFDIFTLRETWLKDNKLLLEYVSIPGYIHVFQNRDNIKGGGVGAYIRDDIPFKRRSDLEQLYPDLEHLWLEVPGRNKNSKLLLGTIYRSQRMMPTQQ